MLAYQRYLKTTLYGMTALLPDYTLLCVCASTGLGHMSREHLAVAVALEIPVAIVITKCDNVAAEQIESVLHAFLSSLYPDKQRSPYPPSSDKTVKTSSSPPPEESTVGPSYHPILQSSQQRDYPVGPGYHPALQASQQRVGPEMEESTAGSTDPCISPDPRSPDPCISPDLRSPDPCISPDIRSPDPCISPDPRSADPCISPDPRSADPCIRPDPRSADPCISPHPRSVDPCISPHPRSAGMPRAQRPGSADLSSASGPGSADIGAPKPGSADLSSAPRLGSADISAPKPGSADLSSAPRLGSADISAPKPGSADLSSDPEPESEDLGRALRVGSAGSLQSVLGPTSEMQGHARRALDTAPVHFQVPHFHTASHLPHTSTHRSHISVRRVFAGHTATLALQPVGPDRALGAMGTSISAPSVAPLLSNAPLGPRNPLQQQLQLFEEAQGRGGAVDKAAWSAPSQSMLMSDKAKGYFKGAATPAPLGPGTSGEPGARGEPGTRGGPGKRRGPRTRGGPAGRAVHAYCELRVEPSEPLEATQLSTHLPPLGLGQEGGLGHEGGLKGGLVEATHLSTHSSLRKKERGAQAKGGQPAKGGARDAFDGFFGLGDDDEEEAGAGTFHLGGFGALGGELDDKDSLCGFGSLGRGSGTLDDAFGGFGALDEDQKPSRSLLGGSDPMDMIDGCLSDFGAKSVPSTHVGFPREHRAASSVDLTRGGGGGGPAHSLDPPPLVQALASPWLPTIHPQGFSQAHHPPSQDRDEDGDCPHSTLSTQPLSKAPPFPSLPPPRSSPPSQDGDEDGDCPPSTLSTQPLSKAPPFPALPPPCSSPPSQDGDEDGDCPPSTLSTQPLSRKQRRQLRDQEQEELEQELAGLGIKLRRPEKCPGPLGTKAERKDQRQQQQQQRQSARTKVSHELDFIQLAGSSPPLTSMMVGASPRVRKGAVLLDAATCPAAFWEFEAALVLLGGHWPARGLISGRWPPCQDEPRRPPTPKPASESVHPVSNGCNQSSTATDTELASIATDAELASTSADTSSLSSLSSSEGVPEEEGSVMRAVGGGKGVVSKKAMNLEFSVVIHCGCVRQPAKVVSMQELPDGVSMSRISRANSNVDPSCTAAVDDTLSCSIRAAAAILHSGADGKLGGEGLGTVAQLKLRFVSRPEWLKEGSRLIVRDLANGHVAGAGFVMSTAAKH
eukprot:gene7097-200_t